MKSGQKEWKYYNHALIPTCAPHEEPDLSKIKNNSIWKIEKEKHPLLVRWTENFDSTSPLEWWYIIKDTPFDINELKAKRRYEINKGNRYFKVIHIEPEKYKEELYRVITAAFLDYPEKYRPSIDKERIFLEMESWLDEYEVLGAFFKETETLCGYALIKVHEEYADMEVVKTDPAFEKYAINAAIGYKIVMIFHEKLGKGFYLCNGARNISHETAYPDYLEKYFNFRKAYCRLYIKYKWYLRLAVNILFPFRNALKIIDRISLIHNVVSILKMEEISRKVKNEAKNN